MTPSIDVELMKPGAYPEHPGDLQLFQTHISFVFIGDEFVYKVKKPVNFGFCDFSTLEKRKYYCEQEIKLNSRLSPDVYLEVVPVTENAGGLFLNGDGPIVDYAVKMKRIPMEKLMKTLLADGNLTREMVGMVGKKIADFHAIAEGSGEINKFGGPDVVKGYTDENFQQTEKYIGVSITREQLDAIKEYTDEFYNTNLDTFQKRVDDGRIKDCHGDLHMEHIIITDPVTVFDCIEFNERFRFSDTAADIAFLVMDLEYNRKAGLAQALMEEYILTSNDIDIGQVLDFYKIYRAYVRGKVISFRLDDPHISDEDKEEASTAASKYFELAHSYVKNELGS